MIPNAEGSRTTPSVVAFTNDNNVSDKVLVGAVAKRQAVANSKNTVFAAKRLIGRRFRDADTQRNLANFSCDVEEAPGGEVQLKIGGKPYSPAEVSAHILRELKKTAGRLVLG